MRGRKITLSIVLAAIVLLFAARTLHTPGRRLKVREMIVQADLQAIRNALMLYKAYTGAYPTTDQGLAALVVKPTSSPIPRNWTQLLRGLPKDPWGHGYFYLCLGRANPTDYDLFSTGPDGKPNTADDDWGR